MDALRFVTVQHYQHCLNNSITAERNPAKTSLSYYFFPAGGAAMFIFGSFG